MLLFYLFYCVGTAQPSALHSVRAQIYPGEFRRTLKAMGRLMFRSKFYKGLRIVFVVLFSATGIQSSYADYYPSGIQQNVSEQTLRDNGWTLFYEQTYGTQIGNSTTPIRPSGQYVILTGKAVGSSILPILSAAPTAQVFTETVVNTPQLLNGTYWYYTLDAQPIAIAPNMGSIGFAPTSTINQGWADGRDLNTDPLRLSWHLHNNGRGYSNGGFRLGTLQLNNSSAYLKQVWTWSPNVRQTSNLTFAQSLYASDTLSDEDGELRKTVDQIMNKYGSLIK